MIDDPELSLDRLTADVSVFQRRKGHRFSSDDVVTAWVAMQVCPAPARVLDLGCGLGSVLLHVAWSAPNAELVGVEVQDESFALVEKNIAHNHLEHRVTVAHGDFREPRIAAALGDRFDLITGTPPYFPAGTATEAMDEQRARARIEHRGGIESYVTAAAAMLAPDGWFVVCGDADARGRLEQVAASAGFVVCGQYVVIPRAGRPPLFSVWALRRHDAWTDAGGREMTLRDSDGERTADAKMLRAFSGFPESRSTGFEAASRG